jgi:tetratricopeptide (TPR) repeat protein
MVEYPDMGAVYFFKGYVTFHQGRHEDAERWFTRSLELSRGKSYISLAYRAAARLRHGRIQEATDDLATADTIYAGSPVTAFWRAILRARAGDNLGALELLEECAARGFFFSEQIKSAPELEQLRQDPRLKRLMRG